MVNCYFHNLERLIKCLQEIDGDFDPPLSIQEKSLEDYAGRLLKTGGVIVRKNNSSLDGIFGYFREGEIITADLLWIAKSKRGSSTMYKLIKPCIEEERNFSGILRAKINENNLTMKKILEKIGFELVRIIENDFDGSRTSLVYELPFEKIKEYFS